MAEASGEKYRRIFSEYDSVFVDAVSSAALSCNLNFFLKKEQMQALTEYIKWKNVVANLPTGYGKSRIYSLCPLVCDNLRNVKSKKERSMLLLISPLTALLIQVTFFPLFLCSDSTTSLQAFWIKIVHDIIRNITNDVKIVFLPYFLVHITIPKKSPRTFQLLLYCFSDFLHGNLWIIVVDFETSQTSV